MLTSDIILQGRYAIMRPLGQGGMGTIYLAKDKRLNNLVAVKETFSSDSRLRKAFEREAQLLASLRHPALPVVSDHFIEGDGQYLVMQFIPGDDLAKSLEQRGGPFPVGDVLDWANQLLEVLDYMHTQKPPVVHRDIKPHNVKLTDRGRIILLDFGLAKGTPLQMSRVTSGGSIYGYTPSYAPFEQIRGAGTDARSDLYSLAATLYHLMTGLTPPDALSRAASIMNSEPDPLKPAHELNGQVPPALSAVLARSMAQKREDRFATAVEMRSALRDMALPAATNSSDAKSIIGPPVKIDSEPPVARPLPDTTTLPAFSPPKPVELEPAPAASAETVQSGYPATSLRSTLDNVAAPATNKDIDQKRSALMSWPGIGVIIVVLIAIIIGAIWLLMSNKDEVTQAGAQRTEQPVPKSSTGPSIPAAPAAAPLIEAMTYYLELEQDGGKTARATGFDPVKPGQRFKFHFTPREGGYLYIIAPGAGNAPTTFLTAKPIPSTGVGSNRLAAASDFQFPGGDNWLRVQSDAGTTQFRVIFSPAPLQKPSFLASSAGRKLKEIDRREIEALILSFVIHKLLNPCGRDARAPSINKKGRCQASSGHAVRRIVRVKGPNGLRRS